MTGEFSCSDHTEMPVGYMGWHAHAEWLKQHRYKQRECDECGLWKIVLAADDRLVKSSYVEMGSDTK